MKREEEIFEQAMALPSREAREAYLLGACGQNRELRRSVDALLAAFDDAGQIDFLKGEDAGPEGRTVGVDARLDEGPGTVIGHYKLLESIGEGGFGVVYVAEQREPVKRRVALKIIKLGMDTRQVVARFEAERQALALMDHPNIAKVLDAGATATGRPYFVMELVRGIPITQYCDQNNLAPAERLELFIQACRAIQHAHQKGIIHRDIKPSNILVTSHDGVPVPKVIDFGIAKATQGELTDKTVYTQFQQFIGTPAYMSPEQAELNGLDVDTRSDIYALGVLLYELLVGRTPFDAKELLQAGLEQMRRTIQEQEPARPSTRLNTMAKGELTTTAKRRGQDARKLISLVRGDLDWIVMKCLEKDRARRYETANGLAADIRRHLNQEPVVARPPSTVYRLQKLVRRNRLVFGGAAVISAILVLGVVASTWEAVRARRSERGQSRLREEAQKARQDATKELWSSYLAQARASRLTSESGRRFESLDVLAKAAAIRPSIELRNEAIACLALADLRTVKQKAFTSNKEFVGTDATLDHYAVGAQDGTVTIRRVADDRELARLASVGSAVRGEPVLSPDGMWLCAPYADGVTRVWDVGRSALLLKAPGGWGSVFRPDSKRLATGDGTGVVVYDLPSGEKLRTLSPKALLSQPGGWHLRFHPEGRLLAASNQGRTNVLVLDTELGSTVLTLPHEAGVYRLAWHPDGRHLATACDDNLLYIWDTVTGERVRTLQGHQNTPLSVAFTHDGSLLASSGWDKVRLWDFATGRQVLSLGVWGFLTCFSQDDRRLGSVYWGSSGFEVLELASSKAARTIHEGARALGTPTGIAPFSRSGRLLAFQTAEGIELWDVQKGREIGAARGEGMILVGFDAQDQNVLVGSPQRLSRWPIQETPSGPVVLGDPIPLGVELTGRSTQLSSSGRCLGLGVTNGLQILLADTFREQARLDASWDMWSTAFSPDDKLLAGGFRRHDGVKVWDAQSGRLLANLATEKDSASLVAFSPDCRRLLTTTANEHRFWEVGSWSPGLRIALPRASFPVMPIFSPDGKILAGVYSQRVVRLFNAATGEALADLEAPNPWIVTGLSFNPDATLLAVCEGRVALHVWDLRYIREQLAKMGLDWDLPPYPPAPSSPIPVER